MGKLTTAVGDRIAWIGRWICYRWYLAAPIDWPLSWAALPYAGDYAYQTFEEFRARRAKANEVNP